MTEDSLCEVYNFIFQAYENKYRVRELPMLETHPVNTALVKDCPGNLAYYQLARESFEKSDLDDQTANEGSIEIQFFIKAVANFEKNTQARFQKNDFENYFYVILNKN